MTLEELQKTLMYGQALEVRSAYDGKLLRRSGSQIKQELLPLKVISISGKIRLIGDDHAKTTIVAMISDYNLRNNG